MSDISGIFQTQTAATTGPSVKTKDDSMMGKEDFLTLLVAQLKNQDPLNPDDPTEFTSQLAQFSSLEQLTNLNTSMESLANAQLQSERLGAMTLIGKEVVYPSADFALTEGSATVGYQIDGTASSVSMHIQNEAGAVVATLHPTDLSKGNHFVEWDGLDNDGNVAPDGQYKIILQANADGDQSTVAISPLVRSEVTGLVMDPETGAAILQTTGGQVKLTEIIATYNKIAKTIADDELAASINNSDEEATSTTTETIAKVAEAAGTATSSNNTESAPKDEDQITQDLLTSHLSGQLN